MYARRRRGLERPIWRQVLSRVAPVVGLIALMEWFRRGRALTDQAEARALLAPRVDALRRTPYGELRARAPRRRRLLGFTSPDVRREDEELTAPSGRRYLLWRQFSHSADVPGGIEVDLTLHEGHYDRGPLIESFVMDPSGAVVRESHRAPLEHRTG
jgi:hypothetical protein